MKTDIIHVYGYLFASRYDHILEYRVRLDDDKFYVYKGKLDKVMQSFPDEVLAHLADEVSNALRFIVHDLRAIEIENGTYLNLENGDLPTSYLPIVAAIEEGIDAATLPSVLFFGEAGKYKDPKGVQKILNTFGFNDLKTLVPEVYVLKDYIKEERSWK